MNAILEYLMFMLFGSEDRTRFTLLIMIACIPIGILVAQLPPALSIIFWISMVFAWRWMILDIKKKIDKLFKR
jgi:hypothetical protein